MLQTKPPQPLSTSVATPTPSEPLSVDAVLTLALQLTSAQRSELIHALTQFASVVPGVEPESAPDPQRKCSRGRSPRIEAKLIRGCGPYYYYRWWAGKTYRSTYLGKTLPQG